MHSVLHSDSIMSHANEKHIPRKKFASISSVDDANTFIQAPSIEDAASPGTISEVSSRLGDSLQEGDLITGIIDIANECAYMVPPVEGKGRNRENKAMVCARSHLAGHAQRICSP